MRKLLLAALAAASFSVPASAATLYTTNFNTTVTGAGVLTTGFTGGGTIQAANTFGNWTGNYLDNRAALANAFSTITFTNLAPHTQISISMILGFLESWDGDAAGYGPDNLEILIDGVPVITGMTSNQGLGSYADYGGGTLIFSGVQANSETYYSDRLVDMNAVPALSFAHTGSTLTLTIRAYGTGWQGGSDEGFGIDSLDIQYDAVAAIPEPATWAMMLLGFGAVGGAMRRRSSKRTAIA